MGKDNHKLTKCVVGTSTKKNISDFLEVTDVIELDPEPVITDELKNKWAEEHRSKSGVFSF